MPESHGPDVLAERLAAAAAERSLAGLVRRRQAWRAGPGRVLHGESGQRIDFCSNDYLGLATEPAVASRLAEAAREYGSGSGASALVSGFHPEHAALESELAEFLERDAVLLCGSGYAANLAVAAALCGRGDRIIQDRLCHASLIDGARLSGAQLVRYSHADVDALRRRLRVAAESEPGPESGLSRLDLVVTDGVFSMDGDIAPLVEIAALAAETGAALVVDDAHGIGVMGPDGRGSTAVAGLGQAELPVLVGTLGKAFGCVGAFIAGSRELVEHLVNSARPYLFSTALPPAMAAAAREALAIIRDEPARRERLAENIDRFRTGAERAGLQLLDSTTPIQPVIVGDNNATVAYAERLAACGFQVGAIRPPTVPRGTARLRVTLSSAHDTAQIDGLLEALEACHP